MLKKLSIVGILVIAIGFIIWGLFLVKFSEENSKSTFDFIPADFEYVIHIENYKNFNRGILRWGLSERMQEDDQVKSIGPWIHLLDSAIFHESTVLDSYNILLAKNKQGFVILAQPNSATLTQNGVESFLKDDLQLNNVSASSFQIFGQSIAYGITSGVLYFSSIPDFESISKIEKTETKTIREIIEKYCNKNAEANIVLSNNKALNPHMLSSGLPIYDVYFKNNGVHLSGWIKTDAQRYSVSEHDVLQSSPVNISSVQSYSFTGQHIRKAFNNKSLEYYNWIGSEVSWLESYGDTLLIVKSQVKTDPHYALEETNLNASSISIVDSLKKIGYNNFTFYKNYDAPFYQKSFSTLLSQSMFMPNWYAIVNENVIFSSNVEILKKYLDAITQGDILTEQPAFSDIHLKYDVSESSASEYTLNTQLASSDLLLAPFLKGSLLSNYTKISNEEIIANLFINQSTTSQGSLNMLPDKDTLWSLEIEGLKKVKKSKWIYNHRDGEYNILMLDQSNTLHSITQNGKVKWKKSIDGEINSDFQLVDLYRNNKKQLVFTTKKKVYIVDILGRDVNQFPYTTQSEITSPVSFMDYDKNGDYRIFVGLANGSVINLNREGQIVEGWSFTNGKNPIVTELRRNVFNNYDYLHFVDSKGKLYATGRRGEDRLQDNVQFPKFYNQGVVFNEENSWKSSHYSYVSRNAWLYNAYINKSYDSLKFETDGPIKIWDSNFSGSDDLYWLSTTPGKIAVFNKLGLKAFEFATNVSAIRFLYPVKRKNQMFFAFLDENDKKVYLLDKHGEIVEGFPKMSDHFLSVLSTQNGENVIILTSNQNKIICLPL